MADTADQAEHTSSLMSQLQIQAIRNRGRELNPTGECHWCFKPFEEGSQKVFCNATCGTDYENNKRLRG